MTVQRNIFATSIALSAAACQPARTLTHVAGIDRSYGQLMVGEQEADMHVIDGDVMLRIDLDQTQLDRYTTGDPTVRLLDVDESDQKRGPRALLQDADGLWQIDRSATLLIGGGRALLRAAAWRDDGLVTLEQRSQGGCTLVWHSPDLGAQQTLEMPERACAEGALLRVDRQTGDAFVITLSGVWGAQDDGRVTEWADGGDLARFDPAIGAVIIATRRDTELHAWSMDGVELWYVDLGEPIVDFDDLGTGGALAVLSSSGLGGRVALLDTLAGAPITAETLPLPPLRVRGAEGGGRIVIGFEGEMHVFDVDLEGK